MNIGLIVTIILLILQIFSFIWLLRQNHRMKHLSRHLRHEEQAFKSALLQRLEAIEVQTVIESGMHTGTNAVEKGHHVALHITDALVTLFSGSKRPANKKLLQKRQKASTEMYDSVREVNRKVNEIANRILNEWPWRKNKF